MKKPAHLHIWQDGKCACGQQQCAGKSYSDKALRAGGRCQNCRYYEDGMCGVHHKASLRNRGLRSC